MRVLLSGGAQRIFLGAAQLRRQEEGGPIRLLLLPHVWPRAPDAAARGLGRTAGRGDGLG